MAVFVHQNQGILSWTRHSCPTGRSTIDTLWYLGPGLSQEEPERIWKLPHDPRNNHQVDLQIWYLWWCLMLLIFSMSTRFPFSILGGLTKIHLHQVAVATLATCWLLPRTFLRSSISSATTLVWCFDRFRKISEHVRMSVLTTFKLCYLTINLYFVSMFFFFKYI